jgi:hypothetical protein
MEQDQALINTYFDVYGTFLLRSLDGLARVVPSPLAPKRGPLGRTEQPAVTAVDARWQLQHGLSLIAFDTTPAVRITDGSFVRVFASALWEAVRIELFKQRVEIHKLSLAQEKGAKVVSLHPALRALRAEVRPDPQASLGLSPAYVVYPNLRFRRYCARRRPNWRKIRCQPMICFP